MICGRYFQRKKKNNDKSLKHQLIYIKTFLLRCALIGATTALIIRIIILFIQKQPRATWFKPLLKTGISGALLGMAGGYVGYLVSTWVAGFSQHWLVLLLSAIIAAFAVGWVLQMLLERLVWRRLGWR